MRINPLFAFALGLLPHHTTPSELNEAERISLRTEESGNENESNPENFVIKPLPDLPTLKILSNLDWKNLKNCRLVCGRWDRLLRERYFHEGAICFQYPPPKYKNCSSTSMQALSTTLLRDGRLKFYTLRWKYDNIFDNISIGDLLTNLLILKLGLECVTRLEIISGDRSKSQHGAVNVFQHPNFVDQIMKSVNNVMELIILDPESYNLIADGNIDPLKWDPEYYRNTSDSGEHYIVELRNLKEIHYSMGMIWKKDRWNSLDFLLIVANSCTQLVKFHIELDYSVIWADEEALMNFYRLIGLILKNNAGSLKNVHIGTRSVFDTDDVLMDRERWWWSNVQPGTKIEKMLETGNWVKEYVRFTRNKLFENFLDTIWSHNWKDFELNVLECLTIQFPLPILPAQKIHSILIPFIQSLRNLKTLKIQPIFCRRSQDGKGYIPLPYLSDIFIRDDSNSPNLVSDIVFFSETSNIDWTSFKGNSQHSTLDLVFKTKRGESKGQRSQRLHWRNVSWKNVNFGNSIVVPHLRHLTRLVIHQNKHCPPDKILTLDDSDFQMILRDGKSLQRLILNCDLGKVTPFGYSGLQFDSLSFMRKFLGIYTKPILGHSIRNLKGLSCLCLIGLKGHEPEWTFTTNELTTANFKFLQNYFSNSDQVKFLILGLDGLTRVRRIDKHRSEISYSYTN